MRLLLAILCAATALPAQTPAPTLAQAESLWKQHRYEESKAAFESLIARYPRNAEYRVRFGRLFLERFNPPEAAKLFHEALEIDHRPRPIRRIDRRLDAGVLAHEILVPRNVSHTQVAAYRQAAAGADGLRRHASRCAYIVTSRGRAASRRHSPGHRNWSRDRRRKIIARNHRVCHRSARHANARRSTGVDGL